MTTSRPSVLLIVIDALRADCAPFAAPSPHLTSLGLHHPELPVFAGLVQGAFNFTQAIACAPQTRSAHASLFTGLLPPEHGLRSFALHALSRDVRTLAEIMTEAGYSTCAMTDQPPVFQPAGLLRGFGTLVSNDGEALAWWNAYQESPRFLFLHLWNVHKPYGMPTSNDDRASFPGIIRSWEDLLHKAGIPIPAADGRFLDPDEERAHVYRMQDAWEDGQGYAAGLQNYLDGLAVFDRGRLRLLVDGLRATHASDGAIQVITSDHGEGRYDPLFAPSRISHGSQVYDDQIRIPLFVGVPGSAEPSIIPSQVSQCDIAPTILDMVGLLAQRTSPRSAHNGRSLVPLMRGQAMADRPAYAEHWSLHRLSSDGLPPTLRVSSEGWLALPCYRVLRYPERKFRLVGEPFVVTDDLLDGPREVFIRSLYRDLFGRQELPGELTRWDNAFEQWTMSEAGRRRALLGVFLSSDAFARLNKYAIYDLGRDPLEVSPRDPRVEPLGWTEYAKQLDIIAEINRHARTSQPQLSEPGESEIIQHKLRDLGYIE